MIRIPQFAVVVLILGLQVAAQNQHGLGRLGGIVVDDKGSPVQGVRINVKYEKVSVERMSDEKGQFLFADLEPRFYSVEIEKKGFKTDLIRRIEVQVKKTSMVRIALQPGSGSLKEMKEGPCFVEGDLTKDTMQTSVSHELDDCAFRSLPIRSLSDLF